MATESRFAADRELRWRRLKGRLFEGLLVAATLFGLASLAVLFALIAKDALGLAAAEPSWYLVYLGTLVGPFGAYTLYVRRQPPAREVNALAFAVVAGTAALALATFAVVDAVGPADATVFALATALPPLAVRAVGRRTGDTHLTGPAIPVSVLVGLGVAAILSEPLTGVAAAFPDWLLYVALVAVPAAVAVGWFLRHRHGRRAGIAAAVAVPVGTFGLGVVLLGQGMDPSLWVVLASAFVVPTAAVYADLFVRREAGRVGLLGPIVLVAGILAGATLEGALGLTGLGAWLTPTLVLDSWSSRNPREAGVYPQIVGSVMIVGVMAVLSFPVGVGAAVYLEEYAPETGWRGRLATALDVNISNLAGVPSVVYGLLGLALFRQGLGLQPGIVVAAGATLGLLILPIVIVSSQEALRSVPDELRQASFGLGASRWQTVRNVVLPEAVPGILTGTILALGRAIGETAPLVMIGVATTRFSPPEGLFSGATALPLQIFAAKGNNIPEYRTGVVAATALVLL
ncbi:MAG: phosphate ABC transporter permease PstA, partial [Halobacteriales archaeon]